MNRFPASHGIVILVALLTAAVALLGTEVIAGAVHAGVAIRNPCVARASFPGHGIDATVQRIVLDGLDGAACRLHTSREGLVLSLRSANEPRPSRRRAFDTALRAAMLHSVDEAVDRGEVPTFLGPLLRHVITTVPIEKLIRDGVALHDLLR
jgi:hypothetical protein